MPRHNITVEAIEACFQYGINAKHVEPADGREINRQDVERFIAQTQGLQEILFTEGCNNAPSTSDS